MTTVKKTAVEFSTLPIIQVTDFDVIAYTSFQQRLSTLELDPSVSEIFIYISSFGGSAYAALAMVEAMQVCSKPVNTVAIGNATSCGWILFSCGTGTRYITKNSVLHAHSLSYGSRGKTHEMEVTLKQAKMLESKLLDLTLQRSSLTKTKLRAILKDKADEWTLSAKESVEYGFADVIGTPRFVSEVTVEIV